MIRDKNYEQQINNTVKKLCKILEDYVHEKEWSQLTLLAVERALQILIEALIGISRYVLEINFDLHVSKSREAITELNRLNILNDEDYQKLIKIIGFRNVLVHDYLNVDKEIVKLIIRNKDYQFVKQKIEDLLAILKES